MYIVTSGSVIKPHSCSSPALCHLISSAISTLTQQLTIRRWLPQTCIEPASQLLVMSGTSWLQPHFTTPHQSWRTDYCTRMNVSWSHPGSRWRCRVAGWSGSRAPPVLLWLPSGSACRRQPCCRSGPPTRWWAPATTGSGSLWRSSAAWATRSCHSSTSCGTDQSRVSLVSNGP